MRGRLLVGQDVGGVRCAELARVYVCVNGVAGSSTPAGNGCQSVVLRRVIHACSFRPIIISRINSGTE